MPTETVIDIAGSETPAGKDGNRKFIRDVFFANVPLPFQKIRTYLWLVFFSRAFGPAGFGIWSLFQVTLGLALTVTSLSQGSAMMRFLSGRRTHEETNRGFSSVLAAVSLSSVFVALVIAGFSRQLSDLLFRDPRGRTVLVLVACIVPLETYFEEMRGFLRARRLNRSWAFFTLGRQVPETVLLIFIARWWIGGPVAAVSGYLVTASLGVLLGFWYLHRCQNIQLVKPSAATMARYLPFGLALIPGALASSLSFAADRYLVGYYLDLQQVGIYSVCFTISGLGFFFCGPLNDVLMPEMAALHDSGDWQQFYVRFSGVQKFVTALAAGSTALLTVFPQEMLRLATTRDFSSGGPALALLGLQGIFMSLVTLYVVILCVQMRVWWTAAVWGVMGAIVLLIDVILVPRIGIMGAAFSQTVSAIAGAVLVVGLNWEIFRRTFRFVWILQTGAALLGARAAADFWQAGALSLDRSLERLALGSMVFVLGLFITRYVRFDELAMLLKAPFKSAP